MVDSIRVMTGDDEVGDHYEALEARFDECCKELDTIKRDLETELSMGERTELLARRDALNCEMDNLRQGMQEIHNSV